METIWRKGINIFQLIKCSNISGPIFITKWNCKIYILFGSYYGILINYDLSEMFERVLWFLLTVTFFNEKIITIIILIVSL